MQIIIEKGSLQEEIRNMKIGEEGMQPLTCRFTINQNKSLQIVEK